MVLREKKNWFMKCSVFAMLLLILFTGNVKVVNAEPVVNEQKAPKVLPDYTEAYGWKPNDKQQRVRIEGNRSRRSTNNTRKVVYLSVFVTFPDITSKLDEPATLEAAELILNTGGEVESAFGRMTVPSLKQSVERVTYGKLTTTAHIFPKERAGLSKVVSYVAPHPRNYYLKNSPSNPDGYTSSNQMVREAELITGGINAMKDQVAAEGITEAQLDSDNDGFVDALSFFIGGGLDGVAWADLLWSHKVDASIAPLPSNPQILGKRVSAWNLITGNGLPEGDIFSKNKPSYAEIFHEYLHTLGLPDFYRGANPGVPVGIYDVMAEPTGGYPQGIMAGVAEERGWRNPLPVVKASGTVTLKKPKYTDPNEKNAVKIVSPYSDNEFFVAEFYVRNELEEKYGNLGHNRKYADSDGLLISRIKPDETRGNMGKGPGTDYLYVFRPGEVSANKGNGNIPQATLSMAKNRTRLGNPSNGSGFHDEAIYLSNGTNTGIVIALISQTADEITFNITTPQIQGTGTEADPFLISEPSDFNLIRNLPEKYFKLTKDIDFRGVNNFTPIKTLGGNKPGVLDGDGKTIKNLTIANSREIRAGFFEWIRETGIVKNLNFENLNVTGHGIQVGGLVALLSGTAENVSIKSGGITNTAGVSDFPDNTVLTGGIAGEMRGTGVIKNSYSSADVIGSAYTGGLAGESQNGTLTNNYVNGNIQSSKKGGVIGLFRTFGNGFYNPDTSKTYYDKRATNTTQGIYQVVGSVAVPTNSGIIGVTAPDQIALDLNGVNEKEVEIVFEPTSEAVVGALEISVADTGIAVVNSRNKIVGVSQGTTKATVKFSVGSHKMELESEVVVTGVPKQVPSAASFKADLSAKTYNKTAQAVTVSANDGVTGLGRITVKYKKGTSSATTDIPIQVGTYGVFADVAEGSHYQAASDVLLGTYTINPMALAAVSVRIPDVFVNSPDRLTGQILEVTGADILTGDTVHATNSVIEFPSTATVGTFRNATVTLGALDNGNYRVSKTDLQNQTYTVIARALTRIYVDTPPTKTVYIEGESFDKRGMVVKAEWQGKVETDVTDQVTIVPAGSLRAGTDKVTITYNGKTVEQSIQVKAKKVPAATDFKADLSSKTYNKTAQGVIVSAKDGVTGLGRVTVKYKKGTNGATTTIPIQAGTYKVIIDVTEGSHYQAAGDILLGTYTINPLRIADASVSIAPIQKDSATQITGQTLAVRGTNLFQEDTVNASNCIITFPSTATEGTFLGATVIIGSLDNINYRIDNNRLDNQSYRVMAATLDEIRITSAPDKTTYFEGETFDRTGMVVKGIWSDGTESDISAQVVIMPSGALGIDDRKVTITYGSQSIEQAITVKAKPDEQEPPIPPEEQEPPIKPEEPTPPEEQEPPTKPEEPTPPEKPEEQDPPKEEFIEKELGHQEVGIAIEGSFTSKAQLEIAVLNEDMDVVQVMKKELGDKLIIGSYDVSIINGSFKGTLTLRFTVDEKYNGTKVTIMHLRKDGSIETFEKTVDNGSVTVEVNELSPFVIATAEKLPSLDKPKPQADKKPISEPAKTPAEQKAVKTGDESPIAGMALLALASLTGIGFVIKKRRV